MYIQTNPEIAEAIFEHIQILHIHHFKIYAAHHDILLPDTKIYFNIEGTDSQYEAIENLIYSYNELVPESNTIILQNEVENRLIYWVPVKGLKLTTNTSIHALMLNNSMGFGIGLHPSTILALRSMKEFITADTFDTVVDVGSGSGILSMYAYKKGIENIHALEIDEKAINTMKINFEKNNFSLDNLRINTPLEDLKNLNLNRTLFIANMRIRDLENVSNILNIAKNIVVSGTMKGEKLDFVQNSSLIAQNVFNDWISHIFIKI